MASSTCEIDILGTDELSIILSFLNWKDILKARVNRKWKEAARITPVPESTTGTRMSIPELFVENREFALVLEWLVVAIPKIPTVNIDFSAPVWNYAGLPAGPSPVNLETSLPKLHALQTLILRKADLNGSYPFLFNFPNLKTLDLLWNTRLKWDLSMLSGLPRLERLECAQNHSVTGNLQSIRLLKFSLKHLCMHGCENVEGSFHDLADFSLLEELELDNTKVTGDIRKIGMNDFVSIKKLDLGDGVYGFGYLKSIADAPLIMQAKYYLKKRNPSLFARRWRLSYESSDRYEINGHHSRAPPFWVEFVEAGPRIGWRWTNCVHGGSCEIHWLDPEPNPSDEGFEKYKDDVESLKNEVGFYEGFLVPPTAEEHEQRSWEVPLDPLTARYSSRTSFGRW